MLILFFTSLSYYFVEASLTEKIELQNKKGFSPKISLYIIILDV